MLKKLWHKITVSFYRLIGKPVPAKIKPPPVKYEGLIDRKPMPGRSNLDKIPDEFLKLPVEFNKDADVSSLGTPLVTFGGVPQGNDSD